MPNPDTRDVVVTQADREAASALMIGNGAANGKMDSHPWVQAFARHRIAAEAECAARVERLEKALRDIAEGQHVDVFEKGRLVLRPYNPAEIARAALNEGPDHVAG